MVFPEGKRGFLRKALFDVLSMLNSNLMPTWFHFASQNRPKIHENVDPKRLPIMHPFSLRFWTPKTSLLGPNLEPSWPSVSHQDGPRGLPDPPQEASQTEVGASLVFKVATRRPRRPPSPPTPWCLLGSILEGRGSILKVFGPIFLHMFEICGLQFFNNLSLMLKHFLH